MVRVIRYQSKTLYLLACAVYRWIGEERKKADIEPALDFHKGQDLEPVRNALDEKMKKSFADPEVRNDKVSADMFTENQERLLWSGIQPDARGLNQKLYICVALYFAFEEQRTCAAQWPTSS
jgi:hypothetical protein